MTRRMAMASLLTPALPDLAAAQIQWRNLPELPKALGGQFAGMAGEDLLVAGGSYFDTPPWSGGVKQRVDTVYELGSGVEHWRLVGNLPQAIASGAAATTPRGLLCVGGQFKDASSRQSLMLTMRDGKLTTDRYPDLPETVSNHAVAYYGDVVYVAGGQTTAQSTSASRSFMKLSLSGSAWQPLPDLPETGRLLPVLIACKDAVFLISGAELTGDPGPPPGRRFLADAYKYTEKSGWKALAPLPRAVQAAPGLFWKNALFIFGGNDGTFAAREFEVRDKHPGFSKDVLRYDIASNRWSAAGHLPVSLATTGVALRDGEFVIAGGEDRPAHRSPQVIAGRLK